MATKLKNLEVSSVDFVDNGANPDAHLLICKGHAPNFNDVNNSKYQTQKGNNTMDLSNLSKEELATALQNLLTSQKEKENPEKALEQQAEALQTNVEPNTLGIALENQADPTVETEENLTKNYSIDLQKRDQEIAKQNTEIAKQQAQIHALQKSLALGELKEIAKKYIPLGKNPEELAEKLYTYKSLTNTTAYQDFIETLDESLALLEKSQAFTELGRNTSGTLAKGNSELEQKAKEIAKRDNIPHYEAITKAFDENPDLAQAYEQNYTVNT